MRPSASFSSFALLPLSSVNTLRSVLPARYGQGAGLVTKKRGKRNGADTRKRPPDWRCGAPRRGSDALLAPTMPRGVNGASTEERLVGKEVVRTGRSRWWPD